MLKRTSQFDLSLGFESIAIKQKRNICTSRLQVGTKSEIMRGVSVEIPIIAANMSTIINSDFLLKLFSLGSFGFMHRALPEADYLNEVTKVALSSPHVPVSVGVGLDQYELAQKLISKGANIILIDIAHGYSDEVINLGKKLKQNYSHIKLVLGNTTNVEMMYEVNDFADAVKVGIAQGLACETFQMTGCTEKQFSCVYKFKEISRQLGLPIISDGGTRSPSDFVKALGAGANSVMAGSVFARCPDSASPLVEHEGKQKKIYAGMASRYVQDNWKGGIKQGTCPEGTVKYLDPGVSVDQLLERYQGALRSGITYAGGKDVVSFQDSVEFIRLI